MSKQESREPIAFLNGNMVPISEAQLHVFDMGIVHGVSITEMIRTFGHRPFRQQEHFSRFFQSLELVGLAVEQSAKELADLVEKIVEHNSRLISESHDLGIIVFATAGTNLTYVGNHSTESARAPSLCIHTFELPFELWSEKLSTGQHLVTPQVRGISRESMNPQIKHRSRLHWYFADQEVRKTTSGASAILMDENGFLTETSSGNFFIVSDGNILTPKPEGTLGGISQLVVEELAEKIGCEYQTSDISPGDVFGSEEAFTSSTPYCLLPVTRFNFKPVGSGQPGPVFSKLLVAWNELAGLDIMGQMTTGAQDRA